MGSLCAVGTAADIAVPYFQIQAQDSFASARRYAGRVEAARTVQLGFKRSGNVDAVAADLGDRVAAGTELASLDSRVLRAELEAANADVEFARASLDASEANARLAANTERRMRKLRDSGHAPQQTYDENLLGLHARLAEVKVAKAAVRRAEAAAQAARVALDEATLSAPFDAIVQARYVDEGSQITVGQPVLKLVERNAFEAHVGLPSDTAARLEPGASYALRLGDTQISAPLRAVLPELDPATRTVTAVFELAQPADTGLAAGRVIELSVDEAIADPGFWIPLAALTAADRGLWSVYVINAEDRIERRLLEVLHSEADRVFARGTLTDADRVVATGVQRIVPGQRVTPVAADQTQVALQVNR
ncbi:MAG: efflux RND transporter periplasmic adaptor subunit [Pseudomonadota bacterium]